MMPARKTRQPSAKRLPVRFIDADAMPILYANQFAIQYHQGDFVLVVGQAAPPLLIGDDEQKRAQWDDLTHVPIKVVARLAISRDRLHELTALLQSHLEQFGPAPAGEVQHA